jgi:hypothetical protein
MNVNKFLINTSKGEKSLTATAFLVGFLVCMLKLLLSGVVIGDVQLGVFSGVEAAAVLGALGVVYKLRQDTIDKKGEKSE